MTDYLQVILVLCSGKTETKWAMETKQPLWRMEMGFQFPIKRWFFKCIVPPQKDGSTVHYWVDQILFCSEYILEKNDKVKIWWNGLMQIKSYFYHLHFYRVIFSAGCIGLYGLKVDRESLLQNKIHSQFLFCSSF